MFRRSQPTKQPTKQATKQPEVKKAPPIQRAPATNSDTKQVAFVFFASTIDLSTMKKLEQHIIGIYTNVKDAEILEKNFNEANEGERDGHFTKAYSVRYTLPYLAPMVKRALDM
jgi:hypothetical protein